MRRCTIEDNHRFAESLLDMRGQQLNELNILVGAGGAALHEHRLGEAVAHGAEDGGALAEGLDVVVVGAAAEGPGLAPRSLYGEGGFIDVADGRLGGYQITEHQCKLPPPGVESGPVKLGILVPELGSKEAHLVMAVEAVQLRLTHGLAPHLSDDAAPLG